MRPKTVPAHFVRDGRCRAMKWNGLGDRCRFQATGTDHRGVEFCGIHLAQYFRNLDECTPSQTDTAMLGGDPSL